ncbi:MAG: 50S ribosomal protein L11 methyltransferase [Deltaproteobacteria bacterium]|nr:50S ribosomal protein L11 methyltransferase [Deltaproteobacteria bacterium]
MTSETQLRENPYTDLFIYYLQGRANHWAVNSFTDFLGNWEEDGYTFLFFSSPAKKQISDLLTRQPHLTLLDNYQMTYDDWQGGQLQPMQIGRFHIVPPWLAEATPMKSIDPKQRILMDPGVVFGNGNHPTTRHCIEAIELAFSHHRIDTALDLGTGTGLLAIVAARLGCQNCLALDLNHLAARTAQNNVAINGCDHQVLVVQGRAEAFIDSRADLLIANIHYDVMRQLVRTRGFFEKQLFILSGLLRSEVLDIQRILASCPVKILKKWEQDTTWYTLLGESASHNPAYRFNQEVS